MQELVDGKRREGEEINWRRNGFHVLRDRNGKVEAAGTAANDTITTALTR